MNFKDFVSTVELEHQSDCHARFLDVAPGSGFISKCVELARAENKSILHMNAAGLTASNVVKECDVVLTLSPPILFVESFHLAAPDMKEYLMNRFHNELPLTTEWFVLIDSGSQYK